MKSWLSGTGLVTRQLGLHFIKVDAVCDPCPVLGIGVLTDKRASCLSVASPFATHIAFIIKVSYVSSCDGCHREP